MRTQKEPIRLRSREIKDGSRSLYLDTYVNGQRKCEYLKLYLVPEKSAKDRAKNRETMQLAEAIKSQKIIDLQNGRFGFSNTKSLDINFIDYFQKIVDKKKESSRSDMYYNYKATLEHLKKYCRRNTTFRDVDKDFVEGWKGYLHHANKLNTKKETKLSANGKHLYWTKFCSVLTQAKKDKIIIDNPADQVEAIKAQESERVYLTIEDLRKMINTECHYPIVKQAFLFSCLTGLRKSDVQDLEWRELSKVGDMWRITFRQIKTQGLQYLDISDEARSFLGEQEDHKPTDKIFADFKYSDKTNFALREWAASAGVHKHITYHSSRHTFALLLLNQSTDIYTVSKLLGHTSVRTTQIYSHILDTKKQEAIRNLPRISTDPTE